MEYLKSGFKSVLGAQQPGTQPSEAEIVERLVERVNTSTLLDDRRDAVRALKALSRKFRLEVGAQAMDVLIGVLEIDRNDIETVGYALETLCNITSHQAPDQGEEAILIQESNDLAVQFTEIFIKKVENVSLLLSLLEEYDFHIRWPSVRLLTSLLINKLRDVQEIILVSPMGVSKLMDLLSESREVIRNDALLLLTYLTKSNANIQKIVAFENAFDRLLDIIAEEGNSDGGIVVEDCLMLLLNLLKNNTSNQNFFKEGSFIQRLTPFFTLQTDGSGGVGGGDENGWSAQKVTNIHLMLQVVRSLVSPSNPLQVTSSSQRVMYSCGLLEQLCNILMASGVPADILTETINTVSEVIRGNHGNQEYFASVTAPSSPPRPAIVVLLMSMVNEKQPFVLRCSVLYCFQCFLYKNELGQAQIIQTLLPTSADASVYTSGQLLCGGLFSPDPLSTWCAAVALSHALVDNAPQKEQLLRVQLATSIGNPPVSLLQQCTSILQHQGGRVQTRLGLLMLLCTWLSNCPIAVSHFVSIPTNVPFLMSQVALAEGDEQECLVQGLCAFLLGICIQFNDDSVQSFNRDSLCQLVTKRIGVELFLDKLGQVSKHETYSQAAQKPQPKYNHPNDVLFDYEFCRLFKSLEGTVIKAVTPKPHGSLLNGPESNLSEAQHGLLSQYKSLIREQDQQITELRQTLEDLQVEHKKAQTQVEEMSSSIQQLKDQNALLKAHRGTQQVNNTSSELNALGTGDSASLRQEITELKTKIDQQQAEIQEKQSIIEKTSIEQGLQHLNIANPDSASHAASDIEVEALRSQIVQKDAIISSLQEENQRLQQQAAKPPSDPDDERRVLEEENIILQKELDSTRKEQEDLLVLLTEQDTKLSQYKRRLREFGDKIDDDDDDDENSNLEDLDDDDVDDEDFDVN